MFLWQPVLHIVSQHLWLFKKSTRIYPRFLNKKSLKYLKNNSNYVLWYLAMDFLLEFPRISADFQVIKTEHASENEVMENVLGNKPKIWVTLLEEHGSSIPIFYSDLRMYNGNITKQAK